MQESLEDAGKPADHEQLEEMPGDGRDLYPPKPLPGELPKQNRALRFIASILLFGGFYYFFISKDLEVILWLAVIVLIHELGHYLAMKIFNYNDLTIFFIPLVGAIAGGSKEKISQREKSIVLLAGPVPGIIIGVILFFVATYSEYYQVLRLSYAFVLINMLNLLPIYPLDGGQLLKTLFLGSRMLLSTIFTIASILLLIVYAVANKEWFLVIIPYFLITRLIQERQVQKVRALLAARGLNVNQAYSELPAKEYWLIRDVMLQENEKLGKHIDTSVHEPAENEDELIAHIKLLLQTEPARDLSATGILLFLIIWILAVAVPLFTMPIL